jgi:hypothetical protein
MKTAFRVWVKSGKTPSWGSVTVLQQRQFAIDGWDIIVAGDGRDLADRVSARADIFFDLIAATTDLPRFSFDLP